jgi:hypothetical protein
MNQPRFRTAAKDYHLKVALRVAEITERICRRQRIYELTKQDPGECDPAWQCVDRCPMKFAARKTDPEARREAEQQASALF